MRGRALVWTARLGVALVLLVAGGEKITAPADFAKAIAGYQMLPPFGVSVTAIVLPWIEVLCGLFILVGFMLESAALLASTLAAAFGVAVISALVRGLDIRCGCFHDQSNVSWLHVAFDLVLLAAAILVLVSARTTGGEAPGSDRVAKP